MKKTNQHQNPQIEIRPYEDTDEAAVANLWREVFPDAPAWNDPVSDIRRKQTIQPELFFIAMKDRQLIGTAMAGFDGHRGWIYYVVVSSNHRRQGIGSALMGHAEAALRKMGCPKLNLQVRASNHEVVAFYRLLGYEVEERISMAKRLE